MVLNYEIPVCPLLHLIHLLCTVPSIRFINTGLQLPNLPASIKDPAVKEFLEKYYEISNNADAHDEYASLFTRDGEFSMNGKKAKGTEGKTTF